MNASLNSRFWLELLVSLGLQASLIFLLAWGLQRLARTGWWRRTIWQVALLALGLMAVLELTGISRATAGWAAAQFKWRRPLSVVGANVPATAESERRSPTRRAVGSEV